MYNRRRVTCLGRPMREVGTAHICIAGLPSAHMGRKSRNFNNSTLYVHAWCYTGYVLESSISTFFISLKRPSPRLQCAGNFNLHVCYELETSISSSTHFLFFHRIARIFNPFFYMFRINSLYVCLLFRIKYLKKTFSTVVHILYFTLFYLVKCTCGRIF